MNSHSSAEHFTAWHRRITTEALVWNEITILLNYEADWLGLSAGGFDEPCAHLELQVLHPMGAPMPLGDGGYWSEFLGLGEAEEAGGPALLATALLNEFSDRVSWRAAWARWEQQDLYG